MPEEKEEIGGPEQPAVDVVKPEEPAPAEEAKPEEPAPAAIQSTSLSTSEPSPEPEQHDDRATFQPVRPSPEEEHEARVFRIRGLTNGLPLGDVLVTVLRPYDEHARVVASRLAEEADIRGL
jgi:hypothetical protein